jgi:hypothetical protein
VSTWDARNFRKFCDEKHIKIECELEDNSFVISLPNDCGSAFPFLPFCTWTANITNQKDLDRLLLQQMDYD